MNGCPSTVTSTRCSDTFGVTSTRGACDSDVFADAHAASDGFLKKPQGKDFAFVGAAIDDVKYFGQGDGLGLRKQDNDLRDAFNRGLATILANGTYQRINRKYFDFDIYGTK